jgi:hypothetical protein
VYLKIFFYNLLQNCKKKRGTIANERWQTHWTRGPAVRRFASLESTANRRPLAFTGKEKQESGHHFLRPAYKTQASRPAASLVASLSIADKKY